MSHPIYQFGDCRVDPLARELLRDGSLIALSPKVFDCLVYLIEHRDRAVGRDELIAAVWGRIEVSDTLLGQTLLKARRAVGDDGNEQNTIRTIPRFGYRWIRELDVLDASEAAAPADAPTDAHTTAPVAEAGTVAQPDGLPAATDVDAPSQTRPPVRRPAIAAAIAIATALLAAAGWYALQREAPMVGATAPDTSIADALVVLPATVQAPDEWSWLRLGAMDLIASRLRHAGQPVAPSDTVVAAWRAAHAGSSHDATDASALVGTLTGARSLVVPRIEQKNGDRWQVRIELRDAQRALRSVDAEGTDPIETARTASDRLLALLGASPPSEPALPLSLEDFDQRIRAALLDDDFDAARRMIEAAPASLQETPTVRVRRAEIEYRVGDLRAARATLDAVVETVSAQDNPVLRARALRLLGAITVREDHSAEAIPVFEEAIRLIDGAHEPSVLGQTYTGLAAAQTNLAHYEEAAAALARARVALTLANDPLALARVDANEGILHNNRGRHAEALPVLRRASDAFRRFGSVNDLALTLTAQAKAELALLDAPAALATCESLLPQRGDVANARSRGNFDLQHARALAAVGRIGEARALLTALAADPALAGEAELPGGIATEDARLRLAAGDAVGAVAAARRAVAALPTTDEAHVRAQAWLILVRSLRSAGMAQDTKDEVNRFSDWSKARGGMPGVTLFARLAGAESARIDGRRDEATAAYAAALSDAESWGVPSDLATVVTSYGDALLADHDLDPAAAVIGRLARWADHDFECALLQSRLYAALGQADAARAALAKARSLAGERTMPAHAPGERG